MSYRDAEGDRQVFERLFLEWGDLVPQGVRYSSSSSVSESSRFKENALVICNCLLDTVYSHLTGGTWLRNCLDQMGWWGCFWRIFSLLIDTGGPIPPWAAPFTGQAVLAIWESRMNMSCVNKQAGLPPYPYLKLLPWLCSMVDYDLEVEINHFLHYVALVSVFLSQQQKGSQSKEGWKKAQRSPTG